MAIDQVRLLREEAAAPHAIFHQFLLAQAKCAPNAQFLFFEGVEDPVFFVGHILPHLQQRDHHEFVCDGRDGVIKIYELCARDGRAIDRSLFFIDKDHSDFFPDGNSLPPRTFQTACYSFENYIVCLQTLRRFWTERLRLQSTDSRYGQYAQHFKRTYTSFSSRMRLLMALILLGRGIDGHAKMKLNLNNVNLDKVLNINFETGVVRWQKSGGQHFLAASNMRQSGIPIRGDELRRIFRTHLRAQDGKCYIRGKFDLWFFVYFLAALSRKLADKAAAKASALPRATPGEIIHYGNSIDSLCSLAPCPPDLKAFLEAQLGH